MKYIFNIFLLAVIFSLTIPIMGISPVGAQAAKGLPVVEQFPNLNLDYTGSLDIGKYSVTPSPALAAIPNTWNALGTTPLKGSVTAIAISGTDVYVGGTFIDVGGNPNADYVAKWDGSTWSALGTTPLTDNVDAIAVSGTDVYVGGMFLNAGGDANADYIAKWNGSTWSALGTTPLNSIVTAIAISGAGVYAGGSFINAGGDANADIIAKWNGSAWSALGAGLNNNVFVDTGIYVDAITINGMDVYAGGTFANGGGDANADYIAKWNGSTWSALGATPLNDWVRAITISGADIYVGGFFTNAGGDPNADYIAKWNGSTWSALGTTPLNNGVAAIAINGADLYAGGGFFNAGGDVNAYNIAKWNGSTWSALGTTPLNGNVSAISISGTDVYAGGIFVNADGFIPGNADYIAMFSSLNTTASIFGDVPDTYWAWNYVERLYSAGITGGCVLSPLQYCPDSSVTRAQMAVFLLKSMHGPSFIPPVVGGGSGFTDVALDYWAAAWIKQLAAEGITGGCGAGIYCPDTTVTRAQMAVFLLKAKHGSSYSPPSATGVFSDVPVGYWADKWIEQLAAEGVTSGCGAGIYCPDTDVTRAQMAVFLVKAFNLP